MFKITYSEGLIFFKKPLKRNQSRETHDWRNRSPAPGDAHTVTDTAACPGRLQPSEHIPQEGERRWQLPTTERDGERGRGSAMCVCCPEWRQQGMSHPAAGVRAAALSESFAHSGSTQENSLLQQQTRDQAAERGQKSGAEWGRGAEAASADA